MVVLIEPGLNPFKFPVASVAAEFTYPFAFYLTPRLAEPLLSVFGGIVGNAIALATVWLLPDAFGFLSWVMQEYWSLYRANRSKKLKPVMIGAHAETLRRLLQPGFHSGTVRRLYAKLRHAECVAAETSNWRAARAARQTLLELEEAFERFVDREIL